MSAVEAFDFNAQWDWYYAALEGHFGPLEREDAMSGFYRDRFDNAIAVWRDEAGSLLCTTTGKFIPRTAEQIDQAITGDGARVVTHEVYQARIDTGRWPDDVDMAEPEQAGSEQAPNERIAAEVARYLAHFTKWLDSIGGKITEEEQNAKVAKYADKIAELKKTAETSHKSEKDYWLEGGRKVDGKWKPLIADADAAKRTILAPTGDFRRAQAAAEAAKRQADIARQRAEQQSAIQQGERAAPISMPPPKATGLRTEKRVKITDLSALAAQIARFNDPDPDFIAACTKAARAMLKNGAVVQGAEFEEVQVPK